LIHATKEDTIQRYMTLLNLNDEQVKRLNKLRLLVRNTSLHY
ncbi:HNH endonuclease, partial [Enterococcus faecalis]|nr:HNH endonuclease [Enterococcus faecalis]